MTMENPGHEGTKLAADYAQQPVAGSVRNPSRRRFNRAGVGASAVVMTLASRSVLAQVKCMTPSGHDSMQLPHSGNTDSEMNCAGRNAHFWIAQSQWPVDQNKAFISEFPIISPNLRKAYAVAPSLMVPQRNADDKSVKDGQRVKDDPKGVLLKDANLIQALSGSETPEVVKNLIVAWLNARHNLNKFPTDVQVLNIYNEWQQKGYYEVRAGVKWYDADINRYLTHGFN
jgi:hypothetical protein